MKNPSYYCVVRKIPRHFFLSKGAELNEQDKLVIEYRVPLNLVITLSPGVLQNKFILNCMQSRARLYAKCENNSVYGFIAFQLITAKVNARHKSNKEYILLCYRNLKKHCNIRAPFRLLENKHYYAILM